MKEQYPGIDPNSLRMEDFECGNDYFKAYNDAWDAKQKWVHEQKENEPPMTKAESFKYEMTRPDGCLEAIFVHFVGPVLFFFIAGLLLSGIIGFWEGVTEFIKALFTI